jgi:yadA domain protein (fragment)
MRDMKKKGLERNILLFLSAGAFTLAGLYPFNALEAAPVFGAGTGAASTVAGESNTAGSAFANAFGYGNTASKGESQAFGSLNLVSGYGSSAFGNRNEVSGDYSNAFGYYNVSSAQWASAFGYGNEASNRRSSAFGFENMASGAESSAFGIWNKATASGATAIGYMNNASGEYSTALGGSNNASGLRSVAIGNGNQSTGESSNAIGANNGAYGLYSNAFGYANSATSTQSNAFGFDNAVFGAYSNVLGSSNIVVPENSTAIGNYNQINSGATNSFALGNNTIISLSNSVALGNASVASAINDVTGNSSYINWAGVSDTVGVVSVGSSGSTRQIQNVAAGQVSATSTDAVNGSQLYAVQQLASQSATVSAADSNITVTESTNSSGGTDYEIELSDQLDIGTGVEIDGTGDGLIDVGNGNIVLDGSDGSIKAGDVTINTDGDGTINGLTNTTWDPDDYVSGQAATEDQLKAVSDTLADVAELAAQHSTVSAGDSNIVITETTNADDGIDYELKLADKIDIGTGSNKVTIDGDNGTISTGNVNINGTNGMISADKITIDGGSGTIGGLTNKTWDGTTYVSGQAATEDQLKIVSDTSVKYDVDNSGTINYNKITLEGSGGTTITNVAPGEVSATSTDAINGSQLYQVQQDLNAVDHKVNKLGDEIDGVGALAAAMAGLHPRFQDGNKGELAMAYGGYGGKSAMAIGGFYAPDEKVMFSVGMGVAEGGRKMGNIGVNFALDRARNRMEAPRDIVYTRKEVDNILAEQNKAMEAQNQKIEMLLLEIENLKAKSE